MGALCNGRLRTDAASTTATAPTQRAVECYLLVVAVEPDQVDGQQVEGAVPEQGPPGGLEVGVNEDEARDDGGAEYARPKQFAYDQLGPVVRGGRQRREDVRTAIAEGQQSDALMIVVEQWAYMGSAGQEQVVVCVGLFWSQP